MLKVLEDVEMMVTTDSEDDQAGAAAGCREMETRRRSHSAINTHHLHINTHLSVGYYHPPSLPRPDIQTRDADYKIFVGRGPQTGFYKEAIKLGNTRQEKFQGLNLRIVR